MIVRAHSAASLATSGISAINVVARLPVMSPGTAFSFMPCFMLLMPVTLSLHEPVALDRQRAFHFFAYRRRAAATDPHYSLSAVADFLSRSAASSSPDSCQSLAAEYGQSSRSSLAEDELQKICSMTPLCPSSDDLKLVLATIHNNDSSSLPLGDAVIDLCPILLPHALSSADDCQSWKRMTTADGDGPAPGHQSKNSPLLVWALAFLCVTLISLTSLVGVVIVPFLNKMSYFNVLNLFEGLAVGSLVGSSIFHLIPQAFYLTLSPGKHEYLWRALTVFLGIYMFYWSERVMNMISKSQEGPAVKSLEGGEQANGDTKREQHLQQHQQQEASADASHSLEQRLRTVSDVIASGHSHGHEHAHLTAPGGNEKNKKKIATVAWMIIFGDGLHNFIDGLSIGAAFNDSILTGISICVAVVCEEFPHELGDFAVLIASGMSIREAVSFNFLSACTW